MIRVFIAFLICALLSSSQQALAQIALGQQYAEPLSVSSRVYPPIQRIWDTSIGPTPITWGAVETSRGVYVWTNLDAVVSAAQAQGSQIIYTFGRTPGWANGNAGDAAPPTSFQDYYDFVTAVVTRYKGVINYFEPWNEVDTTGFWTGTQAQMLTLCQGAYSALKAANPNAMMLSPSVVTDKGPAYLQTYLAGGGAAITDAVNVHVYPLQNDSAPEQIWTSVGTYMSIASFYGIGSKPFIVDEGGWGDSTKTTIVSNRTKWSAIWPSMLASLGVSDALWYAYDASNGWGPLWNGSAWLSQQGIAFREAQKWLTAAAFSSPITRAALTNGVRNPTGSGVIAGTPGTPPTNWTVVSPDSGHGISTTFSAGGTEGGIAYTQWRVNGTATAGASGFTQLNFDNPGPAAAVGQSWTYGAYLKLVAGSLTGCTVSLALNELNGSGSYVGNEPGLTVWAEGAPLQTDLFQWQSTLTQATTATVEPLISVNYTVGTPCDVTLEIGTPYTDRGSVWSGTITKAGGYQGQIIWDSAGGPTSYTASGTYTYQRNGIGQSSPIVGNSVTLTGQPIILENQQWSGWTP